MRSVHVIPPPDTLEIELLPSDDASTITTSPTAQLSEFTVTVALVVEEPLPLESTWNNGCAVKVAVTVDAPLTVIVVEAEVELANVTDPEGEALHAENVYPLLVVAEMSWPEAPALYHVAVEGEVVPPAVGLAANVT